MKTYYCLTALLYLLSVSGCKAKETTLSGQAFIVTRGGKNIKLGLIEVQLIEKDAVREFLKKRQVSIDSAIVSRQHEIEVATAALQKAEKAFELLKTNAPLDNPEYIKMRLKADSIFRQNNFSSSPEEQVIRQKLGDISHQYSEQYMKLGDNKEYTKWDLIHAQTSFDRFPVANDYLSDFIFPTSQRTLTDADGKFSFSYPQDKTLTIFAKTERLVGDKTEKYCWLVNAPAGVEKGQIFLSNNNLVFIDPDSYFKIKPKSELGESNSKKSE